MANPKNFDPDYSYTGFAAALGDGSFPGTQLDNDLANISDAINDHAAQIEDIRRADGALKNGIVTVESLAPSAIAALGPDGIRITEAVEQAEASAASASEAQAAAEAAVSSAEAARDTAQTSASDADGARAAAELAAAQAALFEGPWLDDMPAVAADSTLTYDTVTEGQYVRTRAEGYSFAVAADDAADESIETPGLVKLYARGDVLRPQQFGIINDSGLVSSQATKIQKWFDECMGLDLAPHIDSPLEVVIDEPVAYVPFNDADRRLRTDMRALTLRPDFDGGLTIGAVDTFIHNHVIGAPMVKRAGTISWLADDWESTGASIFSTNAGLTLINAQYADIYISTVTGFTIGAAYHAENYWFAYDNVHVTGQLGDCRYNEVLRTVRGGIQSLEFANEITFHGGRRSQSSATNALGAAFGTVIAAGTSAYNGNNNNRWREPCYEMGASGSARRVPVLLWGAGTKNRWENCRHEAGVGPFGIAHAKGTTSARENSCTIQLRAALVTEHRGHNAGWLQIGGAFNNTDQSHDIVRPIWNSGPMARLLESSGGAGPRIAAPWFFKPSGSGAPFRSLTTAGQAVTNRKALQLGINVMAGIEVATSRIKTWRITPAGATGFQGRYVVQAYGPPETWAASRAVVVGHHMTNDSGKVYRCTTAGTTASSGGPTGTVGSITDNTVTWAYAGVLADFADGAQLCGSTVDSYGTEQWVKGGLGLTTIYGGSFIAPQDGIREGIVITVRAEVTRIHVGVASGTAVAAITGLTLEAFPTFALPDSTAFNLSTINLSDPLPLAQGRRVVTAKPDTAGVHGFYEAGEIVALSTQTSGQPVLHVCSTPGALASAWAGSTSYVVPGHCVVNDSGKVYELVSSTGASASSGGPTGTGKGIVDGGCIWDYLCAKAAFTAILNMP